MSFSKSNPPLIFIEMFSSLYTGWDPFRFASPPLTNDDVIGLDPEVDTMIRPKASNKSRTTRFTPRQCGYLVRIDLLVPNRYPSQGRSDEDPFTLRPGLSIRFALWLPRNKRK